MDGPIDYHKSERNRKTNAIWCHLYVGSKIWHKRTTEQKQTQRYREQTYNAKGLGGGGGMDWELGIGSCKLVHIEWINNKVLLYSTGDYIQYPVKKHNGKEYEKKYVYG